MFVVLDLSIYIALSENRDLLEYVLVPLTVTK